MKKRYYLVNIDETEIDTIGATNEEFISEAEKQGFVYESTEIFQEHFNSEFFSTSTHQLRIL